MMSLHALLSHFTLQLIRTQLLARSLTSVDHGEKNIKKMMASQLSGSGFEELYEPSLFYFDQLLFLSDSEIPRKGREIGDSTVDAFETQILDTQVTDKVRIFLVHHFITNLVAS